MPSKSARKGAERNRTAVPALSRKERTFEDLTERGYVQPGADGRTAGEPRPVPRSVKSSSPTQGAPSPGRPPSPVWDGGRHIYVSPKERADEKRRHYYDFDEPDEAA